MDLLDKVLRKQAPNWTYQHVPPADGQPVEIQPGTAYVTVKLRSARLAYVRKGLQRFYGVVHSSIGLSAIDGKRVEFDTAVSPAGLRDVSPRDYRHVVQINHTLLGPVPYRGGVVRVDVGLFSIASENLLKPYLSLLEKLSDSTSVSIVSQALPYLELLRWGIGQLADGDENRLEICLSDEWGQPLKRGVFVVLRVPRGRNTIFSLSHPDNVLVDASGQPIDQSYLVLEVVCESSRSDWKGIPELWSAFENFKAEYLKASSARIIENSFENFIKVTRYCNDLIASDAKEIIKNAKEDYEEHGLPTMSFRSGGSTQPAWIPDLSSWDPYRE